LDARIVDAAGLAALENKDIDIYVSYRYVV